MSPQGRWRCPRQPLLPSDSIGHHPGVQFQKEGLQLAQLTFFLLLFLLAGRLVLVHTFVFPFLFLLLFLVHPGYPRSPVPARVRPGVVWGEIHRHGRLVVVGESGHELLDNVGSVVRQVVALTGVGRDVEQPDVLVGGVFVRHQDVALEVPPAAGEGREHLGMRSFQSRPLSGQTTRRL